MMHQLNPEIHLYCIKCMESNLPFMKLNDFEFDSFIKNREFRNNVNFTNFSPSLHQQEMFDKLNAEIDDYNTRIHDDETDSDINHTFACHYYGTEEFSSCKFDSGKNFSIFHLNIHSIQAHIDELKTLLNILNHKFDIIAISESKLMSDPVVNINIPGYNLPLITKRGYQRRYNALRSKWYQF